MTRSSKLTFDHDDCEFNISDQCDRSFDYTFAANENKLFYDYIYSESNVVQLKRYLMFFVIKQDFFHSFFDSTSDDLNQHSKQKTYKNDVNNDRVRNFISLQSQNSECQSFSDCSSSSTTVSDSEVSQEQKAHCDDNDLDHAIISSRASQKTVSSMQVTTATTVNNWSAFVTNDQSSLIIIESEVKTWEKAV